MSDVTATESVETPVAAPESVTEATEQDAGNSLPEWAREKLTKANNAAAKYRVQAKEAAEKAQFEAEEKYSAQIKELTDAKAAVAAELETARLESLKLRTALSVGIPGESAAEFAALLQGTTEDELSAHAQKVKGLLGVATKPERPVDPSQGAGSDVPLNGDPVLKMLSSKLGL